MKKLMILAAIAALTLASCAKIENSAPTKATAVPIGFSKYTPRALTKADATYASSTTLVNGKVFGVYSYATANGTAFTTSATGTNFMNGVEVTYGTGGDSDETKNTYSPLRYWPSGDSPDWLTFWAYYPVQANNGITYTVPDGSNGVGTYAFAANATAATMVDFMVSDVVNDKIYGTATGDHVAVNGVVPLTFRHQLTKVQFKFKTTSLTNTTVKLVEAKLHNIKTTGTLTTEYASGSTSTSWGLESTKGFASTPIVYDITFNGANPEDGTETSYITLGTDALPAAVGTENPATDVFLMLPQKMIPKNEDNTQYLEIKWDVITTDGTTEVTTHNTKKLYFKNDLKNGDDPAATGYAAADIDWNKNDFITYTVTIGPKPIQFTATVADWGTEQNGYFNVQ